MSQIVTPSIDIQPADHYETRGKFVVQLLVLKLKSNNRKVLGIQMKNLTAYLTLTTMTTLPTSTAAMSPRHPTRPPPALKLSVVKIQNLGWRYPRSLSVIALESPSARLY